mmetsp:Transcript_15520/g.25403  ORF Transcript_15520/g.25403 Transcript_15520/m.25403 type:complete len:87 (+) Transcript_15520:317-577(+)
MVFLTEYRLLVTCLKNKGLRTCCYHASSCKLAMSLSRISVHVVHTASWKLAMGLLQGHMLKEQMLTYVLPPGLKLHACNEFAYFKE